MRIGKAQRFPPMEAADENSKTTTCVKILPGKLDMRLGTPLLELKFPPRESPDES
jgi:hypothetical protein